MHGALTDTEKHFFENYTGYFKSLQDNLTR